MKLQAKGNRLTTLPSRSERLACRSLIADDRAPEKGAKVVLGQMFAGRGTRLSPTVCVGSGARLAPTPTSVAFPAHLPQDWDHDPKDGRQFGIRTCH
jgi:hypothetical protein